MSYWSREGRAPEAIRSVVKAAEASTVKGEAEPLGVAPLEQHKTESGEIEGNLEVVGVLLPESLLRR
jgi:hypothetical protein